jgi:Xaa-Pro aminopeptidase
VLKGHIAFSMFRFGPDMDGTEADEESRKALREAGLDFNHGVSHGVGHVLAVHEGPRPVGRKPSEVRMAPGMIISNEPGVYLEGRFGIRIENMVYSKEADDGSGMIVTEPLTLVPYERDAIDPALLTEEELAWVNGYHQRIRETVGGLLSGADREFLEEITEPVIKAYI